MTAYDRGADYARRGKRFEWFPPDLETDAECEAFEQGYWREREAMLAESAFRLVPER